MLAPPLGWALARVLSRPVSSYELQAPNDLSRLYREMRAGDVVLVDGEQRVSALVKYATQSQWSHAALYVGDALLRRGGRQRDEARARFGELADRLVVEALIEEGVVLAPLAKYASHNIRVCRPSSMDSAGIDRVVDIVLGDLGKPYDVRNFVDLAALLLSPFKPGRLQAKAGDTCLGHCTDFEVICSGMIGRAFQAVAYPVLPRAGSGASHGTASTPRDHPRILPRDFDLSPSFEIVKFDARDRPRDPHPGPARVCSMPLVRLRHGLAALVSPAR